MFYQGKLVEILLNLTLKSYNVKGKITDYQWGKQRTLNQLESRWNDQNTVDKHWQDIYIYIR